MRTRLAMVAVVLLAGLLFAAQAEEPAFVIPEGLPPLKGPVLVTSCGQAPGALMVSLILDELGIDNEFYDPDLITADELAAQCPDPIAFGVLIVTTGTSLKGMGAAGVDVDTEVGRCTALIAKAKELGVFVIVGQVEGPNRRTDETDEKSIKGMSPLANLLITRSDVNGDGYFTLVAEENKIPQIFIEETLDLRTLLPLLFPKGEGA